MPVLHQLGIAEARRVHDAAREALHALHGGNGRLGEDAVAHDHEIEVQGFLDLAPADGHLPQGAVLRHPHHLGAGPDAGEEAEPLGVGLQVGPHLRGRREVAGGAREGMIGEGVGVSRIVRAQPRIRARRGPHAS